MNLSLQARASIVVALIVIAISAASTYFFISAYSRSRERSWIIRGETLVYTLGKAAEEGLLKEDLSLLRKASHVIQAADVKRVQVFSSIWNCIDAFPFSRLSDAPLPDAIGHFKHDHSPVSYVLEDSLDFYSPILFRPIETIAPVVIGYVRLSLDSTSIRRELQQIVLTNVFIASAVTALAIILITMLIRRLVVRPVLSLHDDVAAFRSGTLQDALSLAPDAPRELRDLEREFHDLFRLVRDKERQLTESGQRIRSLFERVEHAVFRLDVKGSIIEANSRFRTLFGPVTDLCGILIGEQSAYECLAKAASQHVVHLEEQAVGKDGSELLVSLSLYPERDASGLITGYDGYLIDITEKKRMEERLMRTQKLESIGTLAGGIAHDFNNILAGVLGYAELIVRHTNDGDPLRKFAGIIRQAAEQGASLAKKILTVSRKGKSEMKPVDLNAVIRDSSELFQRSMPKNIEITLKLGDDLPPINADPSQLQQVIINLAVNARDAMPAGGNLLIETSSVGRGGGTAGRAATDSGDIVRLSVADTGAGIDTSMQAKIFDPFFTTKEAGKGTGLGLYIVHSVINDHGGYINLYSEPGKGTQFNIYFPSAKHLSLSAPVEPLDVSGSGTILVIDDETHVRELCKDMLGLLGYNVLLAESGAAGIGIYREQKDNISLVILDMVMPTMGGSETFRALKTINPGVKIVLYSGYSHNNFAGISELLERGASGFIQKPFSSQDIGLAIKKALAKER